MACACLRMARALPRCPWPPLGWRSNCRRWRCLTPRWFCWTPRPCPPPWRSKRWPGQLLPYVLHQDEHLPQAQAQGLCVHQMAPYAQAAHDLQGIANWLEQTLAQLPLVRPPGGI